MPKNIFYKLWIGKIAIFFIVIILNPFVKLHTQNRFRSEYQYLSPLPNAVLVQPESDILIREGNLIDQSTLSSKFIDVSGSKSGIHQGKLILSDDGKTIILRPYIPFTLGETVSVSIKKGMRNINGEFLCPLKYQFRILARRVKRQEKYLPFELFPEVKTLNQENIKYNDIHQKNNGKDDFLKAGLDSLPPDFPYTTLITDSNPFPGKIFAAPFAFYPNNNYGYLLVLDENAIPIFYKRFDYPVYDFKLQSNGLLTYRGRYNTSFVLDSSYSIIDSIKAGNGYATDVHELIMLPNGHALLIAKDYETVNMDTIVTGGDSDATVIGNIIQELDQDKNVVFQWRSWDHFQITDATPDVDLTDSIIDYVHCNAIEEDTDGNIIISCRHMDEITKINRQNGDIIWRWGGEYCKNNQFTFLNDSTGFSHQHDIRRISNGDLTLFDNGNLHNPRYTRTCEYQMDEVNKTATLVWQYENNPVTYSGAMGKVQRMPNGNTFIGWGANLDPPSISEVTQSGKIKWAVSFPDSVINYRAFKFNWRTNYFITNPDTVSFINVQVGNSDTANFLVTNNSDSTLLINDIYVSDSSYSLIQSPPFNIPAHANIELAVKFEPQKEGEADGWIHLRSDRYTEMIAQTIFVRGTTDSIFTSAENQNLVKDFRLYQNYPNPFNPSTTISYTIPFKGNVRLIVYDILGREVRTLINETQQKGDHRVLFNASGLSSGVYFYKIDVTVDAMNSHRSFSDVKKFILMK